MPLWCEAQEVLYSWQSPNGTPVETGGTLEHVNQNGLDKRNVRCGDYYTFVLNGDFVYINAGYNVDECSHMLITLADGRTFSAGDEIEVTAMRNNVKDRPASLYFLFHAGTEVPLVDTNVWNNMGQGHDSTIGGGTAAKAADGTPRTQDGFVPSTHTFMVPDEADGARSVSITRYRTGDLLYVSRLVVRHSAASGIDGHPHDNSHQRGKADVRKYVRGRSVVIERSGRRYGTDGTVLRQAR